MMQIESGPRSRTISFHMPIVHTAIGQVRMHVHMYIGVYDVDMHVCAYVGLKKPANLAH